MWRLSRSTTNGFAFPLIHRGTQPRNNTWHGLQKEGIPQTQKFWEPLFPCMLPSCPILTFQWLGGDVRGELAACLSCNAFLIRLPKHHVLSRYCAKAVLTHQLQPGGASDAEVTHLLRVNKEVFLPEANDNDQDCQSRSTFYHLILFIGNIQGIIFTCLE